MVNEAKIIHDAKVQQCGSEAITAAKVQVNRNFSPTSWTIGKKPECIIGQIS